MFEFTKQASFFFSRFTQEGAIMLSQEYCRRANFFVDLFLAQGNEDYVFSDEDLDRCHADEAFLDWFCSLDTDDPCFDRGNEIRHTRSSNG